MKTTLCSNKLEVNCTELADLGERDSFAKNGSRSARYLEVDPTKRMRPHSVKSCTTKRGRNSSEVWKEFMQKAVLKSTEKGLDCE